MNDFQRGFLDRATAEAVKASHPFPPMAAAEAALESNWGNSQLAREANNLFGMKAHKNQALSCTLVLPTREFLNGNWVACSANWVEYADWGACFADRLATLERLANVYPHYAAALAAADAETYITEVSKTWSTDPDRAKKVLSIYQEYTAQP
ncbi:MAG TPA: glucosaminidase domain-containing protein [Candidatus Nitrosotalea sp.]|nr:glucosaminidase domain-containing protein [Candidatus Nitrosotalea sp.]